MFFFHTIFKRNIIYVFYLFKKNYSESSLSFEIDLSQYQKYFIAELFEIYSLKNLFEL